MPRQSKTSTTRKTIAIVGDGETEYFYFQNFKEKEKLDVTIKPDLPTKSGWEGVIEKAEKLISTGTDKVYCVIDYDVIVAKKTHLKYQTAKIKCLNSAKKLRSEVVFIEMMPCLELWFYLHFKYTTKSLSECSLIHNDLKQQYIPDYEKTQK